MEFLNGRIYNQSGRGSLFNRGGSFIQRFVCFGVLNFKIMGALNVYRRARSVVECNLTAYSTLLFSDC